MHKTTKLILWQKWLNPYELPSDDGKIFSDISEEELNDSENWDSYSEEGGGLEDDTDRASVLFPTATKAIMTPMGMIPLHEKTACTKIFKFWIGHTNFNISQNIASIIEETEGVEILDIFTRYRFRIAIGQAFKDREVMQNIQEAIYETKS
jgi:hypothetical protein